MKSQPFHRRVRNLVNHDAQAAEALAASLTTTASMKRRALIRPAHAEADGIFIVLSGWIARFSQRADGSRRTSGLLLPGDFCGIHAICGALTDHAITALKECEVATISRERMDALVQEHPVVNQALWRAKLVEEATLRKWLVNSTDAYGSVAHLLAELHERSRMVGLAGEDGTFPFPLTQLDFGEAVGLTAVHVNRTLKRLKADALIEYWSGTVRIVDIARLHRAANFDPQYLHGWW